MVPCKRTEKYEIFEVVNGDLITIRNWDSEEEAKSEFMAMIDGIYHRDYTKDYFLAKPIKNTVMIMDKNGKQIRHFGLVKYVTITYVDNF